ncbi:MAG: hypothetical protein GC162_00515 [Planctomycetes bacterium]|nr:hypothetical protein [Planctomycetota bacterium]
MICVGLEEVVLVVQHLQADAVYANIPPAGLRRMTRVGFGRWECRVPFVGEPLQVIYYVEYGKVRVRLGMESAGVLARTNWDVGSF